jgi:CubicO group peptidase (beta-lactamase class C family)
MYVLPPLIFAAVCLILGAAASAAQPIVDGPLGKLVDEYMTKRAGFSGVVFVAKGEKVVIAKGYGMADRDKQIPFTQETVFDIGSITKQFTGAAIAKLEMQGKLKADDKLSKYFPNVPADKSAITLYHLLTHSAGLQGDFGGDFDPATREWIIDQALQSKLLFQPGTGHEYANSGFSLLAAIIEQVSGKSYEAYLREQLWIPAGMGSTGYRLPKWQPANVAHGYRGDKDWGTPLDKKWDADGPYWNLRGNGGVLSTVGDLYKWHQVLEGDKVLSSNAKKKVYTRTVEESPGDKSWYSYGWVLSDTLRGTKVVQHNGGNGVFYADFRRYIEDEIVIIVASNRSEDAFGSYVRGIVDIVLK